MSSSTRSNLQHYADFEEHCGPQLAGAGFPTELWGILYDKLRHDIFDAGDAFQLARVESETEDVGADAGNDNTTTEAPGTTQPCVLVTTTPQAAQQDVWLIDHAWTFRVREARKQLAEQDGLRQRVSNMLCGYSDAALDVVYEQLWFKAGSYRLATETRLDEECYWFLMDEVGTAITHVELEEDGNCRVIPLFYPPASLTLSVLWLTKDVDSSTVIQFCSAKERSKCPGVLRLFYSLLSHEEDENVKETLRDAFRLYDRELSGSISGQLVRSLGIGGSAVSATEAFAPGQSVKVATDLEELVNNFRQYPQQTSGGVTYEFVPDIASADLVWLAEYQEDLRSVAVRATFVSQLGVETVLCHKERLAREVRRVLGAPAWLPRTYDAATEMHLFAGDFLSRQASGAEENLWIVKPHCMARSIDMLVSDCLPLLLRQGETGPKILCKYVARPCLFRGRKFDLRLIVAVRQLCPTPQLFLFHKVWPRFALEPYDLRDLDTYEKHWTVMNYANPERMINLKHDEFVVEFDTEHGAGAWDQTFARICSMTREVFGAVAAGGSADPVPGGRTIYGLDVILTHDLQPMLLECTFAPDCHRACVFYPDFFPSVFATLFETQVSQNFIPLV